jgi:hypothetical protein
MLQAKIKQVYYIHPWTSPQTAEQESRYKRLMQEFECGVVRLEIDDPLRDWALAGAAASKSVDEHGVES